MSTNIAVDNSRRKLNMSFNRARHIKYWRMCANILPDHYQSSDASRMFLAFFIVSALDLLDALHPSDSDIATQPVSSTESVRATSNSESKASGEVVTSAERIRWINWIHSLQVPSGGFRGFSGTDLGSQRTPQNSHWDPANLPNTFFALSTLLILQDDLSRVNRSEILDWLPKLQRQDGSFGEILGLNDQIQGGRDLRYCCCAAGILYLLDPDGELDVFNEIRLVEYISNCMSFEGGFGESPLREGHSGLNYCAVATLELLGRRDRKGAEMARRVMKECTETNVRWMLDRETDLLEQDEDESEDEDEEGSFEQVSSPNTSTTTNSVHQKNEIKSIPYSSTASPRQSTTLPAHSRSSHTTHPPAAPQINPPSIESQTDQPHPTSTIPPIPSLIGFNGRPNKPADTCYCFWNLGSLSLFSTSALNLSNTKGISSYLLEKTQHRIGGFGKGVGEPPDVMHSYLGLAALSLMDEYGSDEAERKNQGSREVILVEKERGQRGSRFGLKKIDAGLCISIDAARRVHSRT